MAINRFTTKGHVTGSTPIGTTILSSEAKILNRLAKYYAKKFFLEFKYFVA